MTNSFIEASNKILFGKDISTKSDSFWEIYQEVFLSLSFSPKSILEIGTNKGVSAKILSLVYPQAKIMTFDTIDYGVDFNSFPNITFIQESPIDYLTNQKFTKLPNFDLIMDDASHIAVDSANFFSQLFPMLNSKGIYAIEDWGTGYWSEWPDGQDYSSTIDISMDQKIYHSHNFGLVGFVKSLVDLVHESAKYKTETKSKLRELIIRDGIVFGVKN
jgi:hypothetical protein